MAETFIRQKPIGDYVYEVLVDGVVRYVGKGSGWRARDHITTANRVIRRRAAGETVRTQRFYNRLAKAISAGLAADWRVVAEGMSMEDAFSLEISHIESFPVGQLWNEQSGGQGAGSEHFKGIWASSEGRAKYMAVFASKEHREMRREMALRQWENEDARERNRERTAQQWRDPAFRKERVEALRAAYTAERTEKLREAALAQWADPAKRARIAAASKAATWSPEVRAKRQATLATPEYKAKKSEAQKAAWVKRRQSCSM